MNVNESKEFFRQLIIKRNELAIKSTEAHKELISGIRTDRPHSETILLSAEYYAYKEACAILEKTIFDIAPLTPSFKLELISYSPNNKTNVTSEILPSRIGYEALFLNYEESEDYNYLEEIEDIEDIIARALTAIALETMPIPEQTLLYSLEDEIKKPNLDWGIIGELFSAKTTWRKSLITKIVEKQAQKNAQKELGMTEEDVEDAEFEEGGETKLVAFNDAVLRHKEKLYEAIYLACCLHHKQKALQQDALLKATEDSTPACLTLLQAQFEEILNTMTNTEKKVLELRFGLKNEQCSTLEEIGQKLGVSRERVRQIEAKALRKLRHPNRSRKLKDIYKKLILLPLSSPARNPLIRDAVENFKDFEIPYPAKQMIRLFQCIWEDNTLSCLKNIDLPF